MTYKSIKWYRKGRIIIGCTKMSNMNKNYKYKLESNPGEITDPNFKPFSTPEQMLNMGVFEGKYLNDCKNEFPIEWYNSSIKKGKLCLDKPNPNVNYFKVKSRMSLKHWKNKGWVIGPDSRGWFQWYCRYWLGRRIPDVDKIQIKRWKAFKRHYIQVKKNAKGDLTKRRKQRQALLQWSYNCCV